MAQRMKKFSLQGIEFSTDALGVLLDVANEGYGSDFKVLQGHPIEQGAEKESEPPVIRNL